jgi:hypothetical protein
VVAVQTLLEEELSDEVTLTPFSQVDLMGLGLHRPGRHPPGADLSTDPQRESAEVRSRAEKNIEILTLSVPLPGNLPSPIPQVLGLFLGNRVQLTKLLESHQHGQVLSVTSST